MRVKETCVRMPILILPSNIFLFFPGQAHLSSLLTKLINILLKTKTERLTPRIAELTSLLTPTTPTSQQ